MNQEKMLTRNTLVNIFTSAVTWHYITKLNWIEIFHFNLTLFIYLFIQNVGINNPILLHYVTFFCLFDHFFPLKLMSYLFVHLSLCACLFVSQQEFKSAKNSNLLSLNWQIITF